MAVGAAPVSLDYCIGQVWRHCHPSIYKALSHSGLKDEVLADIDPTLALPPEAMRIPRSHSGGPKPVTLPEGWLDDPYGPAVMGKEAEAIVSGG